MKKLFVLVGAFVLLSVAAAVPAGAFRSIARSDYDPAFRDRQVCVDGINFDVALVSGFTDFPSGTVPSTGPEFENVYITTDGSAFEINPAQNLEPTPIPGLAAEFELPPLADDDPFWDDVTGFDPTGRELWAANHSAPWLLADGETTMAVGTVLYVYMIGDGFGDPPAIDELVVADCMLDPCASEGAIVGTEGDDVLTGTPGDDIICGLGGNDRIAGLTGDDLIFGGDGADFLIGNRGDDHIYGEDGIDRIFGHQGDDMLDGGDGRDVLNGHQDDDVLIGGPDFDVLRGGTGSNTLIQ